MNFCRVRSFLPFSSVPKLDVDSNQDSKFDADFEEDFTYVK